MTFSQIKMAIMGLLNRFLLPKTVSSVEDIRNVRLSDTFRVNIFILKCLGYWPPEKNSKWYVPYAIYTTFLFVSIPILWHLSLFIKCYLTVNSLEQLAPFYICFASIMIVFTASCTLSNSHKLDSIVKNLDCEIFIPKTVKQFEIVTHALRFGQLVFVFYVIFGYLTVTLTAFYPLFGSNGRKLPFDGWFPWDWTKTPYFELGYIYQAVGVFFLTSLSICITPLGSGLLLSICAQLDLLSHKLESIYVDTEVKLKNSSEHGVVSPQDVYDAIYEALRECVKHHKNILKHAAEVNRVLNYTVFYEFIFVAACSCMTMFQLTMVDLFSVQFLSVLFVQGGLYFDLAQYCLAGNEVILRSQMVSRAAFNIPWEYCSLKLRKDLLFFMLALSKPIQIRAANYFIVAIESLTLIVRTSWSYFAVLRRVQSR